MPAENVLIENCTVYHAHGGFVIGSETSGSAKNLFVTDCTFIGTGIRFKTTRGRGGIVIFDMYYATVDPVVLKAENREVPKVVLLPVTEETPQFKANAPAKPFFTHNGDVIMATAKWGKGTVFAVGDPWFYNEYVDGRKLPADFDNFRAANDLSKWLLQQAAKK